MRFGQNESMNRFLFAFLIAGLVASTSLAQTTYVRPTPEQVAAQNEKWGLRGIIAGRVTFADGRPAPGFHVQARFTEPQSGAQGENEGVTNPDGRYEIRGLNPQGFSVSVFTAQTPYLSPSRRVDVPRPDGRVNNVNLVLVPGPVVTVRVRDAETGAPVPGMAVSKSLLYEGTNQPAGTTDATGMLVLRLNRLEASLDVEPPASERNRIVAAPSYDFHYYLKMPRSQAVTWDIKTYADRNAFSTRLFRGRVLGPDGKPVVGAGVTLRRDNNEPRTLTDNEGRFSFQVRRIEPSEMWSQTSGVTPKPMTLRVEKGNLSALVFPTPDETWEGITVRLRPNVQTAVRGRVTDEQGKPLAGISVEYLELFQGTPSSENIHRRNGGVTDVTGGFFIAGLSSEAVYQFTFGGYSQFGHGHLWGQTKFPNISYSNGWLRLRKGETRKLEPIAVYSASNIVSGIVVDAAGLPQKNLLVSVTGPHTNFTNTTDAQGHFQVENIVNEPLLLGVFAPFEPNAPSLSFSYDPRPNSPNALYQGPVQAGAKNVRIVTHSHPTPKSP